LFKGIVESPTICLPEPKMPGKKVWDLEVRLFFKFGIVLLSMLWILVSEGFAFSIGELDVRSQFGEKFDGTFEIDLDFDGPLEVGLGSVDDYSKIGLERQDIIDELILDSVLSDEKLKATFRIRSNKPLFFPSFNLVVRASHNGGTLLENFLVTVDFQQSLALNVRGKKKKSLPKEIPQSKPEPGVSQGAQPAEEQNIAEGEVIVEKKQKPAPVKAQAAEPHDDKASSVESQDLATNPIDPTPIKDGVVHRRRLSGVIWASPRSAPELRLEPKPTKNIELEAKKSVEKNEKTDLAQKKSTPKKVYVLQKGEGLFSFVRKHNLGNYHPAQMAVAIWMRNIDKFIFGNIHGLQAGVKLDLTNLEEYVSEVDLQTARKILRDQEVEWKLTKSVDTVKEEPATAQIPLPSERIEGFDELFKQANGWQTTWKKMEIEKHLSYYKVLEDGNSFMNSKKRLLSRYPKPRVETSSKFVVLKEGVPIVFFDQAFSSETLKSRGLKELKWDHSESGWKIIGEKFHEWSSGSEGQNLESVADVGAKNKQTLPLSFIIHVSSHSQKSAALSLTNRLRENGFDAHWTPVRVSMQTFIYRVYIGRFADWNQAHRMVRLLRKKPYGTHSTAIPYPYTIQVGETNSLPAARTLLESLRKSGLSGLLLVSEDEAKRTNFRVVVGAFKKAENASWMLQQLKLNGFAGVLMSP